MYMLNYKNTVRKQPKEHLRQSVASLLKKNPLRRLFDREAQK